MYRLITLLSISFLFITACSQPVTKTGPEKSEICQQLSTQMVDNNQDVGQPQADSAQITKANLLKQYKDNNCY